jgi:hypothetical protein
MSLPLCDSWFNYTNITEKIILWRIDLLLSYYSVNSGSCPITPATYKHAIIERVLSNPLHRLSKQVPAEKNTRATIEERRFLLGRPRGYIARTPGRLSAAQLSEVTWNSWLGSSVVSWKSSCEEKIRRLVWIGRNPGIQLVEGWQLRGTLQWRLRTDDAIVDLTVDKSSVAGNSPYSNDVRVGSWRISTVRSRC